MKGWGYVLLVWGGILIVINLIGLIKMPEYAEQQCNLLVMGIGLFFGGIYLLKRAKEKKLEEERKKKQKNEWYGENK